MPTALEVARQKVRPFPRRVLEFASNSVGRVDRENRMIHGVKILGARSGNSARVLGIDSDEPYEYTPECLRDAVELYQGVSVYCNHPHFDYGPDGRRQVSRDERRSEDKLGWIVHPKAGPDGIRGTLCYLQSHPLAERVVEAAERNPFLFKLSHNAVALPEVQSDGRVLITKISAVNSVDLIAGPGGTTVSLFESEAPVKGFRDQALQVLNHQMDDAKALEAMEALCARVRDEMNQAEEAATVANESLYSPRRTPAMAYDFSRPGESIQLLRRGY